MLRPAGRVRRAGPVARAMGAERGFAMAEACIAAAIALPFVAGAGGLAYLCFARVYVQHASYEAAVCAARAERAGICERRLREGLERVLPIGRSTRAQVRASEHMAEVDTEFETAPGWIARGRVRLPLPLSTHAPGRRRRR